MEDTLAEYHDNLRKEQAEVALHRSAVKKQWKTNLGKALFAMQDCISFFLRLSLLVKDCQNPRDPLQPASKKKKEAMEDKGCPFFPSRHLVTSIYSMAHQRSRRYPFMWPLCENHARKMRTFFTRRLEPKAKSSNAFKWSLRPKRK